MKKTIIKNICALIALLICIYLTIFFATYEDESVRTLAILGIIALTCAFMQACSYVKMYYNYKELYVLVRDANRKRIVYFLEGNVEKVNEYNQFVENSGTDMLKSGDFLQNSYFLMPRKRIIKMNQDVKRMMKQKYPPL